MNMFVTSPNFDTYQEWREDALRHDRIPSIQNWIKEDSSSLYDYRVIRRRLEELKEVRASNDVQRLLFYLNEGFHGNMAGMGSAGLYQKTRQGGTKQLISDYVNEMVAALEQLESVPNSQLSKKEKRRFFRRFGDCYGRSALMLSGAGALGPFHAGVVKVLVEHDLVPGVVSGSSAGSIIAAMLGTRKDARDPAFWDNLDDMLNSRPTSGRASMGQQDVLAMVKAVIPDLTFEEALAETGININVSVAPTKVNQRARLLNAVQSPNAYVHEAVLASCAVPGVFPPVTLAAKTFDGGREPYIGSRKWMDGSVTHDLPARQLARIYGVNHTIGSQANPAVLWALTDPSAKDLPSQIATAWQSSVREWAKAMYPFVMDTVRDVYPMNVMTRFGFGFLTQDYTADINIALQDQFIDPTRLLSRLTTRENQALIRSGERATWPKVEMIRNCTAVSRSLDRILARL